MKFEYFPPVGSGNVEEWRAPIRAGTRTTSSSISRATMPCSPRRFSRNTCASPARPSIGTSSTSTSRRCSAARCSRRRRSTPPRRRGRRSPTATGATSRRRCTRPRSLSERKGSAACAAGCRRRCEACGRSMGAQSIEASRPGLPISQTKRGRDGDGGGTSGWRRRLGCNAWKAADGSSTRCFCPR